MKKLSTLFLKIIILFLAVGAIICLLWFPQTEGRAANLDQVSIYLDPLIIYTYIASIPFFIGLYQGFKLLSCVDSNNAISKESVNALKNIKLASISIIGFIFLAELYIHFLAKGDDPAGPTMLGIIISLIALTIGTTAAVFQKILQNAVDLKTENDLTV